MINLTTDTANQTLYLTLNEARSYPDMPTFTNYLMVITREENSNTGEDLAQVLTVVTENDRFTQVTVSTVGLELPGRYRYTVYGQNSAVNTDPDDASVVGIVEEGWAVLSDGTTYYTAPTIAIQNDVIFGG